MVDEAKRCPGCLGELNAITWSQKGYWLDIHCPGCSHFEMVDHLVKLMRKRVNLTPDQNKYLPDLPAYIRSESQEGNTPRLDDDWSAYVREWKHRQRRTKSTP
jgi:hypothetical protein